MGKRIAKRKLGWRKIAPVAVFLVGLLLVAFASRGLWTDWRNDVAARNEYTELRNNFEVVSEALIRPPLAPPVTTQPDEPDAEPPAEDEADRHIDMSLFTRINPDFVGWISIAGTSISYPVVQGPDNVVYLDTTFSGEWNPAGAIFMDYRTEEGFAAPLTMLHGHNMRDGSMFAPLMEYLDPAFLNEHSEIAIVTADGEILLYEIFRVRWTTAWDRIYLLDPNDPTTTAVFDAAPEWAGRILLLSTCASDGDRGARVLVYAAMREVAAERETGS